MPSSAFHATLLHRESTDPQYFPSSQRFDFTLLDLNDRPLPPRNEVSNLVRSPSIEGVAVRPRKPLGLPPRSNVSPRRLTTRKRTRSEREERHAVEIFLSELIADCSSETEQRPQAISAWLEQIDPDLEKFSPSFIDYGLKDVQVLADVYEDHLRKLFELLKMNQPHQELILSAFKSLDFRHAVQGQPETQAAA